MFLSSQDSDEEDEDKDELEQREGGAVLNHSCAILSEVDVEQINGNGYVLVSGQVENGRRERRSPIIKNEGKALSSKAGTILVR